MAIAINVKSRNMEITEGLREYAEKRLQKLEKFLPGLREATVRECVERNMHRVEVTIEGDGVILRGEERTNNMYASVDLVLDKLEQRIKRHKERHTHLKRHAHDDSLRTNILPHNETTFDDVLPSETEPEVTFPRLVREKRVTMKPMSREEAVQMIDLIDHDFYIFLEAATDQVQVIYRRKDGNLGLIAPKI
jgi:putative sigma-54 modulation protein